MGQRSQIFVRVKDKDNNTTTVARYYQWNFQERMLSRARAAMEWMKDRANSFDCYKELLPSILDVNFDYRDIVRGRDLFKEWEDDKAFYETHPENLMTVSDYIFNADNNDGKLFIDMTATDNGMNCVIKYAFVDDGNCLIGDGRKYLEWDRFTFEDLKDNSDKEMITDNLNWIDNNAELMTDDEVKQFLNTFCETYGNPVPLF